MKATSRVLTVLAVMIGATSLASANSFTFAVNPTQTFGTPVSPGGTSVPTIYSLATLGTDLGLSLSAGSTVSMVAVGQVCYNPNVQLCGGSSSANEKSVSPASGWTFPPIEGFFVGSTSAPTGSHTTNLSPTGLDEWTSNITGMFDITGTPGTGNIVIPVGTTGIEFAFVDSYYVDNSDFSGTLGVQVSAAGQSSVPEPATYGMMIAGLGALVAFKRLRRS